MTCAQHKLKTLTSSANGEEMLLSPLEQYAAWMVVRQEDAILRMGKYFYIGMKSPAPIPTVWWEVDCHFLGFLTERKCRLLCQESKDFIENFILGERYKKYRRLLQNREVPEIG
jgi:hypothetical protein